MAFLRKFLSIISGTPSEPEDKYEFLEELTSSSPHINKSFFQHLKNVQDALVSQNLPKEVCDAGLFHSVYGTEFYKFQNNRITRDVVRGYIGPYAEELVYIFCRLKKDRHGVITQNKLGLGERHWLDLCYIEQANLRDQNEDGRHDAKLEVLRVTIEKLEGKDEGEGKKLVGTHHDGVAVSS